MKQTILAVAVVVASAAPLAAEQLVALTATNDLVRFDSATPGTSTTVAITGIIGGDLLVGIDVRPSNNVLYAVATDGGTGGADAGVGRIYSIDPFTGAATLQTTLVPDPNDTTAPTPYASITGDFFGVDFNPTVDLLRLVSDTGQNLRIDVMTGATQLDTPIAYNGSDDNNGSPPMVVASAYTNSISGAVSTKLYGLDANLGTLVDQTPANDGTLNTVALTSLSIFQDAGFDISGATGTGYVVLDGITLGTIDLTTGEVAEAGVINTVGSITGLAVLGVIPEPGTLVLAAFAFAVCTRRGARAGCAPGRS